MWTKTSTVNLHADPSSKSHPPPVPPAPLQHCEARWVQQGSGCPSPGVGNKRSVHLMRTAQETCNSPQRRVSIRSPANTKWFVMKYQDWGWTRVTLPRQNHSSLPMRNFQPHQATCLSFFVGWYCSMYILYIHIFALHPFGRIFSWFLRIHFVTFPSETMKLYIWWPHIRIWVPSDFWNPSSGPGRFLTPEYATP